MGAVTKKELFNFLNVNSIKNVYEIHLSYESFGDGWVHAYNNSLVLYIKGGLTLTDKTIKVYGKNAIYLQNFSGGFIGDKERIDAYKLRMKVANNKYDRWIKRYIAL